MSTGQAIRVLLGVSILVVVIIIYFPHLLYIYSSSAVVNANLIALKTPIAGALKTDLPQVGTELHPGDRIALVENERVDRAVLERAETDYYALAEHISALKSEREKLIQLKKKLLQSGDGYKEAVLRRLRIDIARAKGRHQELKAARQEAINDLNRKQALFKKGYVSKAAYDLSFYTKEQAANAAEQARLDVIRLVAEHDAATRNIYILNDGRKELPYQQQREDEIAIRLADLESKISENRNRFDEVKRNLDLAQKRFEKLQQVEIKAPIFSTVWRRYLVKGTFLEVNSPIVQLADCSNIFIEAVVHERFFEKIHVGDPVEVRFPGHFFKTIPGRVMAVKGGTTNIDPQGIESFASTAPIRAHYEIRVYVEIDPQTLPQMKAGFCHVGRNVEVIFKNHAGLFFSGTSKSSSYFPILSLIVGVLIILILFQFFRSSVSFAGITTRFRQMLQPKVLVPTTLRIQSWVTIDPNRKSLEVDIRIPIYENLGRTQKEIDANTALQEIYPGAKVIQKGLSWKLGCFDLLLDYKGNLRVSGDEGPIDGDEFLFISHLTESGSVIFEKNIHIQKLYLNASSIILSGKNTKITHLEVHEGLSALLTILSSENLHIHTVHLKGSLKNEGKIHLANGGELIVCNGELTNEGIINFDRNSRAAISSRLINAGQITGLSYNISTEDLYNKENGIIQASEMLGLRLQDGENLGRITPRNLILKIEEGKRGFINSGNVEAQNKISTMGLGKIQQKGTFKAGELFINNTQFKIYTNSLTKALENLVVGEKVQSWDRAADAIVEAKKTNFNNESGES